MAVVLWFAWSNTLRLMEFKCNTAPFFSSWHLPRIRVTIDEFSCRRQGTNRTRHDTTTAIEANTTCAACHEDCRNTLLGIDPLETYYSLSVRKGSFTQS